MPLMENYMQQIMGQAGAAQAPSATGQMMRAMTWIGIGIWLLWAVVKVGLYIAGRRYLNRPYVVDYFAKTKPPQ